jgi:DNA repair protein RadC
MKTPTFKLAWQHGEGQQEQTKITCSREAAEIFRAQYDDSIHFQESFYLMILNRANEVIGTTLIASGGTSSCIVDLKYILSAAFLANGTSAIMCHNHPSGNLKPSMEDDKMTAKIKEALKLIDVTLHDSVILHPISGYYSYADEGLI